MMLYATSEDADCIREWINADDDVAWIVKVAEANGVYAWKAVGKLERLQEQDYAIWHVESGSLTIPSATSAVPDAKIENPFRGWTQRLSTAGATAPWFGANLPGPYLFQFAEQGCEAPGSLGRSEFAWAANRYRAIGKPAHPAAMRWWRKLRRYLARNSEQIQWLSEAQKGFNPLVYVFPNAMADIKRGRHRDVNVVSRRRPLLVTQRTVEWTGDERVQRAKRHRPPSPLGSWLGSPDTRRPPSRIEMAQSGRDACDNAQRPQSLRSPALR